MTNVVHCKKEAYDILIDRSTPFGNPFSIGPNCSREESINKHLEWLLEWLDNKNEIIIGKFSNKWVCQHLYLLRDKIIGCWCKPLPCHGDNLVGLLGILLGW